MKTTIFSRMIAIIAIAIMTSTVMLAQRSYVDVPAVPGTQLSKFTTGTAGEDPDLITTGTKVPYLVYPDSTLTPLWAPGADASNSTNLTSTFTWTIPGTIGTTASGTNHYILLDVTGAAAATGNIVVAEQSASTCPGSTTTMAVKVVAKPVVTAASVTDGTIPLNTICGVGTNGSLAIPVPAFSITTTIDGAIATPNIKIHATLTFVDFLTGTPTAIFTNQVLTVSALGTITLPGTVTAFNSWGTYTLNVLDISDKISRKDMNAAAGYFAPGAAVSVVYSVLKTPTTGKIYHILNNNGL